MNYLRESKLKPMDISSMKIDLTNSQNLLYISDRFDDNVVVRYSRNKMSFKCTIDILRPDDIVIDENHVYITSFPNYTISKSTNQVHGLQKNSNCVFVLNKTNYSIERVISFNDWLTPQGLFVDENSNLLTTAFELDRFDMTSSDNLFLRLIDSDGGLLDKNEVREQLHGECRKMICFSDEFMFICYEKHLDLYRIR